MQIKNTILRIFLIGLIYVTGCFLTTNKIEADSSMWSSQMPMPISIASFVTYLEDQNIIVLGGANNAVLPNKYVSSIGINGELGNWSTSSFESKYWLTSAESSNNIYILGGANFPPEVETNSVEMKPKSSLVSSWAQLTPLPVGRALGGAIILNNRLYYAGGRDGSSAYKQIFMAPVNSDGTIGAWTQTTDLPTNLESFGMFTQNNRLIIVGGDTVRENPSGATAAVWSAPVDSNGNIGTWVSEASMPEPLTRFSTARVGNAILIIGGMNSGGTLRDVIYYSALASDGTVGPWQTSPSTLPKPTCCGAVAATSDYLYSIGGYSIADGYLSDVNKSSISAVISVASPTPTNTPTPTPTNTPTPTPTLTPTPTPTPSLQLNLPISLYKQTNVLWTNVLYDSANTWASSNPTIGRWGCALTDVVMVLQYYGYIQLPNGVFLDPKSLNAWLKSQPDGYVDGGNLNWLSISRLTELAKNINHISFDALEYSRTAGFDTNLLKTLIIAHDQPGILDVVGHFVVAKGISNNDFTINDPFYPYTLASSYPTIQDIGTYTKSNTDLSYILLTYPLGATVHVFDSAHHQIGQSFTESPLLGAPDKAPAGLGFMSYYVQKPSTSDYTVTITSNTLQTFDLKIYSYDQNGNVDISKEKEIVGPQSSSQLSLQYHKDNAKKSKTKRVITFDTLQGDIKTEASLGDINPFIKNTLLDLAQGAKDSSISNKRLSKRILQSLERIIDIQPRFLMKESAKQLLRRDIDSLEDEI